MSTTRSIGQMARMCLGVWLLATVGCARTGASPKPAASPSQQAAAPHAVDLSAARAGPVSVADDPNAVAVSSTIRKVTVYSDRAARS